MQHAQGTTGKSEFQAELISCYSISFRIITLYHVTS
jgi:hypothetical protein